MCGVKGQSTLNGLIEKYESPDKTGSTDRDRASGRPSGRSCSARTHENIATSLNKAIEQ